MTAPSFAIFISGVFGNAGGGDVVLDGGEFCCGGIVVIAHALDAAEDFGEVDGLDGDAVGFEDLFAVADGVEGGGAGADGADAEAAQAADDAADGGEPVEIVRGSSRNRALRCGAW